MSNAEGPAAQVRVLLVEDESLILDIIRPALEEAGYAVIEASSGHDAVFGLENETQPQIRAVITDVDLGSKVTGWAVAKRARELHADIPVIYMTGGSAHDWSANGVPNSVLISKPFAPVQIIKAISQLLNAASPPPSASA
jgi:DNA-binding response OmpR family regulator